MQEKPRKNRAKARFFRGFSCMMTKIEHFNQKNAPRSGFNNLTSSNVIRWKPAKNVFQMDSSMSSSIILPYNHPKEANFHIYGSITIVNQCVLTFRTFRTDRCSPSRTNEGSSDFPNQECDPTRPGLSCMTYQCTPNWLECPIQYKEDRRDLFPGAQWYVKMLLHEKGLSCHLCTVGMRQSKPFASCRHLRSSGLHMVIFF